MVVYIQKKIKNIWRTVLTIDSVHSGSAFKHLCKQYCLDQFRISTKKTDDMPVTLKSLSGDEALDALYDIQLAHLTCLEGKEAFRKIVHILRQVCKRCQR